MTKTRAPRASDRADVRSAPQAEPMVDARVVAVSLRLPHYWFADPVMRDRFCIPHYLLGGLVRYRMTEVYTWASRRITQPGRGESQLEGRRK